VGDRRADRRRADHRAHGALWSERIRGHGIPEAIEAILINGSRVEPRVALLKPLSSAISIGSGGPFGAEGPIIMTGGAVGSLIAQFFHLTSAERKTLLVAGAAAGMSATFAAPLARFFSRSSSCSLNGNRGA
jgi:H+/Cl- antiporter ClcA